MNAKLYEKITVLLFCLFLLSMMLLYLLTPKNNFSINEKRYLEEFPTLSWSDVSTGKWGDNLEKYMADHIPARDFWVGLNAYSDLFTGRQITKDIWRVNGQLVEAPCDENDQSVFMKVQTINSFAETVNRQVDFAVIPSAGWATGSDQYPDKTMITSIYSLVSSNIHTLDLVTVFQNHPELYYSTDHHWNSAGAYAAYVSYLNTIDKSPVAKENFEIESVPDFHGSTYSRSALWLTASESIELWNTGSQIAVTNGESDEVHQGVFYRSRLEEADKYTVFLDGNHSIVRTHNPNGNGKILVIRDSFGNSLGCFLAESYEEVVLVDLRYYKRPVSELVTSENYDQILVCYSLNNFVTDSNLIFLK